ncbi:TetR/AcrR family transcriptional regulator [Desulfobacula toluolica]|uniref:TetR/AcrR family transcriptional regulator n=1 Tax=Desulfobacula toluolica TaxID=28223 RepID=UPI0011D2963B|nr:TetR/AcrR family transcriptional regulator [Desulfobacula toluolica]
MGEKKKEVNNNRRKLILKAAQEIFSQKSLMDSNISEIAKKAGIADSIIYNYFKNKEDLLFYALSDKLKDIEKDLKLHLEGILDPASKLGKMIWYHLYINDRVPGGTQILKALLFECRSNKNFYTHEGYNTLRGYTRFMSQILQQGVDENVFRPDINVILVRNLIFGLLDEESLSCLASKEIESTLSDFSGIMDLIFAIISKNETPPPGNNDDKENRILKAAIQVFSNKGYNTATISDIAGAANVAEGTIYTYFDNKKDMLFSIPKKRFCALKNSMGEMFNIKMPVRKLRRFIRLLFTTFMGDRDFLRVFLLDIKLNKQFYASPVYKDYINYISILEDILEEGKEQCVFRKSINPRLFRHLFVGAFNHLATRWLILSKEKPIDMMQEIEDVLDLLCRSVVVNISVLNDFEDRID